MFERFTHHFSVTSDRKRKEVDFNEVASGLDLNSEDFNELHTLLDSHGGDSFNHGVFTIYQNTDVILATKRLFTLFPGLKQKAVVFGYNWLGDQFAFLSDQRISMLKIAEYEAYTVGDSLTCFLNDTIPDNDDEILGSEFFKAWKSKNKIDNLNYGNCAGYVIHLGLGGKAEDVDNLEVSDLDIYIEMCTQIETT